MIGQAENGAMGWRFLAGLTGLATFCVTAALASVPPPVPPSGTVLVSWSTEAVSCEDDARPAFLLAPDPVPTLGYGFVDRVATVTATFRIDADGRPLGVAQQMTGYVPDAGDLLPALVAARFASGQPHARCSVRFVAVRQPVSSAAPELAMQYTMFPSGTPPRDVWERTRPVGSNCVEPTPAPLLRAYPDFKEMAGVPGRRSWSMVGFDLDAGGRPVRPHVIYGSGLKQLDAASIKAVAASRFEKGRRTGCLYPYYRNAVTLAAPTPPEEDSLRPAGANCPRDLPFATPPRLSFPEPYRRRSIEGWAVLAYDVAPWGEIGNVRVLAAEPSADFGDWGKRVLASARKTSGTTGYVGCIERVRFRIGPQPQVITSDTARQNDAVD